MLKKLFLLIGVSFFLAGCTNPLSGLKLTKKAGLHVSTLPQANVYLDGESIGTTPVKKEDLKPGEHSVKIAPLDPALGVYETKIKLTAGTITVIDRTLAANPTDAHGFILSFEPLKNNHVEMNINSNPESVTIKVDDSPQGFTPQNIDTLPAGEHTIILSSPGYNEKTVRARTMTGFKLNIVANLSKSAPAVALVPDVIATPSATPTVGITPVFTPSVTPRVTVTPTIAGTSTSSATVKRPYVEVLDTPTGYLNVRQQPAGDAFEPPVRVKPGDKLPYLETSTEPVSGWYKIKYSGNSTGWVASQYARLVQ
jgi:hypothetical protein